MKKSTRAHANIPANAPTPRGFEAFERTRAEREAVSRDQLSLMNVDVTDAVSIVYGALPSIRALRPMIVKLDGFDIANVDALEDYALSAELANARYTLDTPAPDALVALLPDATAQRDRLLGVARGLATWGLLDAAAVAAIVPASGYRPLADQLVTLAQLFRAHHHALTGRSPVTDADVDHAALLGEQVLAAIGVRDHASELTDDATLDRRRAFTLVDRAYDQVRRAVTYLRWTEGDLEQVVPSIHAHSSAARKADRQPSAPATPAQPATPATDAPSVPAALVADAATRPVPKSNPFSAK